ncbi:MAG: hydantoinase/oxoprolinase family protein [Gammaproteobacteria bacterium]|nr:hydantoinase/oxoprolinase family protein [Gammaproteobacteria bacterium]
MLFLGIDTGGTFTDFVLVDQQQIRVHKVLSSPNAPERAILQGIDELGISGKAVTVIHGSTVATNAVLEGKGVATAYVTNTGFKDVLTIGRQARRELYNLQPHTSLPPVADAFCLEVDCRLSAEGEWIGELSDESLCGLAAQIAEMDVEAVAINLLFSYIDDSAEQKMKSVLPDDLFVSVSSEVLPEIGEYERGVATWLNSWVGPLIQGYISRLQKGLGQNRLAVMQSSGETMDATQAASQAVRMLLSGPAGGLVGARFVASLSGRKRLMTFDMGGTSSDVALIDGDIQLTNRGKIDHYPVAVPMVDMHTIGAGGGSIAYLDSGGMLQVGPESAGASPGPACYGKGGLLPTVTDANLVLGRIPENSLLGGYLPLKKSLAETAVNRLATKMHVSLSEAAMGIVDIANEHMARALRVISVQKGYDPNDFTLVSFGGAGGLHVCALADKLEMKQVLIPVYAGVLSALGMLATRPGRQLSRTHVGLLNTQSNGSLEKEFEQLAVRGRDALMAEGVAEDTLSASYSLDLRYQGQSNTLNITWQDIQTCEQNFHFRHERRYGHRLEMPVELVNIRAGIHGEGLEITLQNQAASVSAADEEAYSAIPVSSREKLPVEETISGPAILVEKVATIWIAAGWNCTQDTSGNLILTKLPSPLQP